MTELAAGRPARTDPHPEHGRPALEALRDALRAAAAGDFAVRLPDPGPGEGPEAAQAAEAFNALVARNAFLTAELTRMAQVIGRDGRMTERAPLDGVEGGWAQALGAVNGLVDDLVRPTTEVARVIAAVAEGDLSQKMALTIEGQPFRGEFARIGSIVNAMVAQLQAFANEVTRVAREVGTEGALGGQAEVPGVAGTWKDLTDNVNFMARNLTDQVRNVALVTTAVAQGDLSQKITVNAQGEMLELKSTINTMVDQLRSFAAEVTRVAREVGTEGRLGGQAEVPGVAGTWKDLTENVNFMAGNLTSQVRNIAEVTTAVARGDLSQKITVDVRGEVRELKDTINRMVDQLRSFADEVTRVAREVGTEGKLGGQAQVPGVAGTWRDLTDNVNSMAENLTGQVRGIAVVTTAVAQGDLSQKITVDAQGEILELKSTINTMVDQLRSFADEVTRVAREVGTEGRLGGQAEVAGVSGTWKGLTENVNQLAANLTTQVRAIAEVSTAVTEGDLTRSIDVEARGEVADLADTINRMVEQLRATTQVNAEQDWLKTNLARIAGLLQGQRDLGQVTQLIMSEVTPVVSAQHGAFFLAGEATDTGAEEPELRLAAGYAYRAGNGRPDRFRFGDGLVGQAALEGKTIVLRDAPPGYVKVASALGESAPAEILVLPIMFEEQVLGVVELAALRPFSEVERAFLEQIAETLGIVLNTLRATMRTEELLVQSQALTAELRKQSEELRQSSSYKSEFLANMSHELRTPLNSLLILSRLLAENPEGTLTRQQVEFAGTIHAAGNDLLALINDILDLSKVEAGKMEVNLAPVAVEDLRRDAERSFRPVAEERGLEFRIEVDPALPPAFVTDEQRLSQVLRNLLSNAFKFTHTGSVELAVRRRGDQVVLSVTDTGVGIATEQLALIFEAFQQADGTTSRKYGGTGLGLSISREISRLLGGEIEVSSQLGGGSVFALVLPLVAGPDLDAADAPSPARAPLPAAGPPDPPDRVPAVAAEPAEPAPADDRLVIARGDRVVLVVGADPEQVAAGLAAVRRGGARGLVAHGAPSGLAAARELRPDVIVLLDAGDAGHELLGRLKQHPETRHRPVVLTGPPAGRLRALRAGAAGYATDGDPGAAVECALEKAERRGALRARRLAVVQDGDPLDHATLTLLGAGDDVDVVELDPAEALGRLQERGADCAVLALGPGADWAVDLLGRVAQDPGLAEVPLVAYLPEPAPELQDRLDDLAARVNLTTAGTPERLVDATALFLHRAEARLPEPTRRVLAGSRTADEGFRGRKVLVVDDDIRNVFALASILEQRGMQVVFAENGREGIARLREHPDVDLVLLDVMMPEMDGYETARAIRAMDRFAALPIISLTAKAMKGDRRKSLDAGASDYITKPVDVDALLSLMRVWLHR